ncbi:MAG: RNA polymerase sigma factor [Treponema sp.]|nr:RNA polymerase sigma factor [Treponema sp.]
MKRGFPVPLSLQEQYDKIYRYCYFKIKDATLAEDLTQETFLRFFNRNNYIGRGEPLAWLYSIAKNLCVDTYRKKGEQALPAEIVAVDSGFDALEISIDVKKAVSTLPKDLQEILLLRFSSELSMKEIGAVTGLSRFAARRKITGALKKIRLILRKEDFA